MESFRGYTNLSSEESDTEPDMMETGASGVNPVEIIMRKMERMELQTETLKRELNNVQQKEENNAYAKTWERNVTPETNDLIARV